MGQPALTAGFHGWAALALCLLGTGRAFAAPPLKQGAWGAEHASVQVDAERTRIEFDCGHGEIPQPFELDAKGRFDLPGTYSPEGGPLRQDGGPRYAARYSGSVEGNVMKLKVVVEKERVPTSEWTLERGRPARLRKCG